MKSMKPANFLFSKFECNNKMQTVIGVEELQKTKKNQGHNGKALRRKTKNDQLMTPNRQRNNGGEGKEGKSAAEWLLWRKLYKIFTKIILYIIEKKITKNLKV